MKMAVWSLIIGTIGYVQYVVLTSKCRGNDRRCLIKKAFIENFAKFTRKHLCWSHLFKKSPLLKKSLLFKKATPTQVFSCEFREIFKKTLDHWVAAKGIFLL